MAHLRKHQRLTVGFLSDVFAVEGRELLRIPTDDKTSDSLTKAMARVRHQALMDQLPLVHIDGYQEAPRGGDDLPVLAAPAVVQFRDGFLGRLFYMIIDAARERLAVWWSDPEE